MLLRFAPELSANIKAQQAIELLARPDVDVVLGPSDDGGYYLIGLSRPCTTLFEGISWSTDQVFERTTQNAESQGYTLKVLPHHYDIDTIEDLRGLHNDLLKEAHSAPQTRKYLEQLAKLKPDFAIA